MDAALTQLLDESVGPAPWYWETFPRLRAGADVYRWRLAVGSVVVLERPGEAAPLLALGFYARALPANPGHVLVWRPERRALRISIFELERLRPLDGDRRPAPARRGAVPEGVAFRTPPAEEIAIRDGLGGGLHRYHGYRSRRADALDEVILLGNGPPRSRARASIYVWRPRAGEVDVLPQDWFTADAFDLGYEWITRVVRDPRTGCLVGDGIRISPFVLSEDGRTVAR